MAAKNPRVGMVLDPPLYRDLKRAAKAAGVSVSSKARELVRMAMELEEDAYWAAKGEERLRSFDRRKALTHEEIWR